jgi:hypothetical protein
MHRPIEPAARLFMTFAPSATRRLRARFGPAHLLAAAIAFALCEPGARSSPPLLEPM